MSRPGPRGIIPVHLAARLRGDISGLALLEFAFMLPVFLLVSLTGAELTNYIIAKMRISQVALQIADNAARMGNGSQQAAKKINETDINDLFIGANLQSDELKLRDRGHVILSDLEQDPAHAGKYRIRWQRCYGYKKAAHMAAHTSPHPTAGDDDLSGIGPPGRQVSAQVDNATMFVEVYYEYKPLIGLGTRAPTTTFTEIASMAVRDRRDLSDDSATTNLHPNGVYKVTGETPSTC